ncbi:hypothetical protein ACO0RG_002978 [Hanseniaspora osmophila]
MCGILFFHSNRSAAKTQSRSVAAFQEFDESVIRNEAFEWQLTGNEKFDKLVPYIVSRGPNYCSLRADGLENNFWFSSVLSLRTPFTKQSIEIDNRFILQYNGELYNKELLDEETAEATFVKNEDAPFSDTQFIVDLIRKTPEDLSVVVKQMYGEFAYTIYDKNSKSLYFGRDRIGKRSLSYQFDQQAKEIFVTSCSGKTNGDFTNCDANKMYKYEFTSNKLHVLELYPPFQVDDDHIPTIDAEQSEKISASLFNVLRDSVRMRVETIHPMHMAQNNAISVLFSGGLDCSVIVALICSIVKPGTVIELLNVGFENPRTKMQPANVPDRVLGWKSYEQLQRLFPLCDLRFIEVDIPYEEYLSVKDHVIDLIYPKETEMDLSIAIAFYFASRGKGSFNKKPYNRKGLVLFSGLGADELYGGYHKFANKSREELSLELTGQINNIHDRNLNRDDKVIASNGVEVRYPFLDEKVILFSTKEIPLALKTNKAILRHVAETFLHLTDISQEPKRAIQFGAKSAKMTKGQTKGTDLI